MKKATKILAVVMAMVLCVCIGVGATLAWLTDRTGDVVNTFAPTKLIDPTPDPKYPGKDGFDIYEHASKTNADGSNELQMEKPLVQENTYPRVLPDVDLNKDPFVHIKAQEDAYVYVEIVDTLPGTMTWKIDNNNWTKMEGVTGPYGGSVYKYTGTIQGVVGYITPGMGAQDINILLNKVVEVAPTFEPDTLKVGETDTLTFYAYAAQHAGQDSAEAAWTSANFQKIA